MRASVAFGFGFALFVLFMFFIPVFPYTFESAGVAGYTSSLKGNVSLSYIIFTCGTINNEHLSTPVSQGPAPNVNNGYYWDCYGG